MVVAVSGRVSARDGDGPLESTNNVAVSPYVEAIGIEVGVELYSTFQ